MISSLYHVYFMYIYIVYSFSLNVSLVYDVVWIRNREIGAERDAAPMELLSERESA